MSVRAVAFVVIASVGAGSCHRDGPPRTYEAQAVPASTAAIPLALVAGKIAGKPFSVEAARYSIDRRPGFEQLFIELLGTKPDKPCADIVQQHPVSVWLRRSGATLAAESVRFERSEATPWQAHYQTFSEKRWSGNGDATALLSLGAPDADMAIAGEVAICFADAQKSCVAGRFVAVYCPIRIDALVRGSDTMQRPPPGKMQALAGSATPVDVKP